MTFCYAFLITSFIQICFLPINQANYMAVVQDKIEDCSGYKNMILDFSSIQFEYKSGAETSIYGNVTINEDIEEGSQIQANVYQEVDGNKEYVCGVVHDLCTSFSDKETPWYPILDSMGITECPIKKGIYTINNIIFDISNFQDLITSEYCGDYISMMKIFSLDELVPQEISCHELPVSIIETNNNY